MSDMVERVARALAERHGDNWDHIPDDKSHWTQMRGQFGGRFRDVNERYRSDYLDEADAAIKIVVEDCALVAESELVGGCTDNWIVAKIASRIRSAPEDSAAQAELEKLCS